MSEFSLFDIFRIDRRSAAASSLPIPMRIPNLVGYWDARQLNLADGSLVTVWPDLSGNGLDVSSVPQSTLPTFRANHLGLPAVEYDSLGDRLGLSTAQQASTLFAKFSTTTDPTVTGNQVVPVSMLSAGVVSSYLIVSHVAANVRYVNKAPTSWQGVVTTAPTPANTYYTIAGVARANSLAVYKDGVFLASSPTSGSYKMSDEVRVGDSFGGGDMYHLVFVAIYDRPLTDQEIALLNTA